MPGPKFGEDLGSGAPLSSFCLLQSLLYGGSNVRKLRDGLTKRLFMELSPVVFFAY